MLYVHMICKHEYLIQGDELIIGSFKKFSWAIITSREVACSLFPCHDVIIFTILFVVYAVMDVCTLYFAIQLHALLIENSCFLTTNSSADFQVLQVKMPQELQNEEKSSQSEVDEGIQATAWEGYDTGRRNITSIFLIPPHENLPLLFLLKFSRATLWLLFSLRTQPLSLRGREIGQRDMIEILLRTRSRP